MAPPNDGCSLFLRDLDELRKYARGRGRCQLTIAAGQPPGGGLGAPGASTTESKPMGKLVQSKGCAEIEDISHFETMQTVLIS
jgi:hypothetical protein